MRWTASVLAAVFLVGCSAPASRVADRGNAPAPAPVPGAAAPTSASQVPPARSELRAAGDREVRHALSRLTYGSRPGEVERVRALGLDVWLERQLHPEKIDDSATEAALAELATLRMTTTELLHAYPRPDPQLRAKLASGEMSRQEMQERYPMEKRPARITAELQAAKMVRAVTSERQLQEVMVDFWFNHFNVFANKGDVRWYVSAYEREAIRPYALGKFPELVRATAHHPAMLFYLDNWLSARPDFTIPAGPNRGRKAGLNENYARELMELHTLGVDGGYTQKDVTEVARAFTGWTLETPRQGGGFAFDRRLHDPGPKIVLGHVIKGGGGQSDGEAVLDILASRPSTARFIATKLVRRFVSDAPPPALVDRAAARFRETGGDLREVMRTILMSPEFRSPDVYAAKVKSPFEFAVSALRAAGSEVVAGGGTAAPAFDAKGLVRRVRDMGMALYQCQPPTGYGDTADAWMNSGALVNRINFALELARGDRQLAETLGAPDFQKR